MSTHQMTIEFDGRFGRRWNVLCACGFSKRAKDQLEAEETVASHKNRFGDTKNRFEETFVVFVTECEALVEKWRKTFHQMSNNHFGDRTGEGIANTFRVCAEELEALLDNGNLVKRRQ